RLSQHRNRLRESKSLVAPLFPLPMNTDVAERSEPAMLCEIPPSESHSAGEEAGSYLKAGSSIRFSKKGSGNALEEPGETEKMETFVADALLEDTEDLPSDLPTEETTETSSESNSGSEDNSEREEQEAGTNGDGQC
ncbi:hypothetical protein CPB86DRAFT_781261, partial [Serendipita vermifera]